MACAADVRISMHLYVSLRQVLSAKADVKAAKATKVAPLEGCEQINDLNRKQLLTLLEDFGKRWLAHDGAFVFSDNAICAHA
jgi:hypothetical protein